jgi:hypothetical protein
MMGIVQKYSRATLSSNLKDDAFHHDHEKLAAVALSGVATGSPANLLFRVKYANDYTSYPALLGEWETIVLIKAVTRNWPQHINAKSIARQSLEHWVMDVCPVCVGRGHLPVENVPTVLSDDPCPACSGTGAKPIECEKRNLKYFKELIECLDSMVQNGAILAMKKLRRNMDF